MAKEKQSDEEKAKNCFIVTPIGELNSETNTKAFGLINAVMRPVLKQFNYEPIAASDIASPGSINKQIIVHLYEDELVIANLTGLNPNVMYELAVRHAVKKPVIIMAERHTKLPFDLVDQRCIFYDDSLHGVEKAKAELESFLTSALTETAINNPIYDSIKENQIIKFSNDADNDVSKYLLTKMDRIERFLLDSQRIPGTGNSQKSNTSGKTAVFRILTSDEQRVKELKFIDKAFRDTKLAFNINTDSNNITVVVPGMSEAYSEMIEQKLEANGILVAVSFVPGYHYLTKDVL